MASTATNRTPQSDDDEIIATSFKWKKRHHKKIKKHQSQLVIDKDRDVTFEEAIADFVERAEIR